MSILSPSESHQARITKLLEDGRLHRALNIMLLVSGLALLGFGLSLALLTTLSAPDRTLIASLFAIAYGTGTLTTFGLGLYLARLKS